MANILEITTNDQQYRIFPFPGDLLHFKVKAAEHVSAGVFTENDTESQPRYFVNLYTDRTDLTKNRITQASKAVVGLLNPNDYQGYWWMWRNGTFQFGRDDSDEAILAWTDCEQAPINFISIYSHNKADWILDMPELPNKELATE